ncbi:MAG: PD-(D/E)XK nuclease family protein [Johnsonella sp.]|nr:PD-(D/E)XK nuclease family protein [Johnsonella sp.]
MKFIIGASGSGKSRTAYEECIEAAIKDRKGRYIFLVPEQYTLQAQKNIVRLHPDQASANIDVLSFNRLAYRVFEELGIRNPEVVDDIAKAMIIKKIATDHREKLGIWRGQFLKPGFLDDMKSMISELYQYGIDDEKLEEISSGELSRLLGQKISDMRLIYREFSNFIRNKFIVAEEIPDVLARNISKSELIRKSYFFMDGFTGFTPVQYRIIEEIARQSRGICTTVCIGSGERDYLPKNESELFYMGKLMYQKLAEIAEKLLKKVSIRDLNREAGKKTLRPRFREAPALDFLERHFLRYDHARKSSCDRSIKITKALDIDAEIEALCFHIMRLIKEEKMRYRDIAVIGGGLESYEEKLRHYFERNEIPYFMDANIRIRDNMLSELVKAALEVITEDYSYESLMRYLRCGLLGGDLKRVCMMDNYMLACGIKSYRRMKKSWDRLLEDMDEEDLQSLNEYREEILAQLAPLHKALHAKEIKAKSVLGALENLFENLEVEEKLKLLAEDFAREKDALREREYRAVYQSMMELFDKIGELLEGESLRRREISDLINAGIEQIGVGIIPAKTDRVMIGDLKRSRLDEIKALFMIGANEGVLPKMKQSRSILNDREKEKLKNLGLALSSTAKEDIFIQRFYLYMNLGKPSKYLYISFAGMDKEKKTLRESSLIPMIRNLFEDLEIEEAGDFFPYTSYMAKKRLTDLFAKLRKGSFAIGNRSPEDISFRSLFALAGGRDLVRAATYRYEGSRIAGEAAADLFGRTLFASVTRMEKFVDCPYAHFLQYGLHLYPRQIYSFEAVDIGNLVHAAIERVFRAAKEGGRSIEELEEKERDRLVEKVSEELIAEDVRGIFDESAKNLYMAKRLVRMTKQSIRVMAEQLKRGDFIPGEFEKSFTAQDCPEALKIPLEEGADLRLQGKIDRVDFCETKDGLYVKIIDYKTGSKVWEPDLAYYGKQMQLVLYLDAVMELSRKKYPQKQIIPAAMFYLSLDDPLIDLDEAGEKEDIDRAIMKLLRPSGLVNTDLEVIRHLDREAEGASDVIPVVLKEGLLNPLRSSVASTKRFAALRAYIRDKSAEIGREILSGEISARPSLRGGYSACMYCNYASVCGFDKKTSGYRYLHLKKIKAEEVWEIIDGEKLDEGSEECDKGQE